MFFYIYSSFTHSYVRHIVTCDRFIERVFWTRVIMMLLVWFWLYLNVIFEDQMYEQPSSCLVIVAVSFFASLKTYSVQQFSISFGDPVFYFTHWAALRNYFQSLFTYVNLFNHHVCCEIFSCFSMFKSVIYTIANMFWFIWYFFGVPLLCHTVTCQLIRHISQCPQYFEKKSPLTFSDLLRHLDTALSCTKWWVFKVVLSSDRYLIEL